VKFKKYIACAVLLSTSLMVQAEYPRAIRAVNVLAAETLCPPASFIQGIELELQGMQNGREKVSGEFYFEGRLWHVNVLIPMPSEAGVYPPPDQSLKIATSLLRDLSGPRFESSREGHIDETRATHFICDYNMPLQRGVSFSVSSSTQ